MKAVKVAVVADVVAVQAQELRQLPADVMVEIVVQADPVVVQAVATEVQVVEADAQLAVATGPAVVVQGPVVAPTEVQVVAEQDQLQDHKANITDFKNYLIHY